MIKCFDMRNCRGICSSVEMLKGGCMARERLGTPDLHRDITATRTEVTSTSIKRSNIVR